MARRPWRRFVGIVRALKQRFRRGRFCAAHTLPERRLGPGRLHDALEMLPGCPLAWFTTLRPSRRLWMESDRGGVIVPEDSLPINTTENRFGIVGPSSLPRS
ncbi:hypothetical protein Sp245p_25335 (plasmid) [Azospirillum baldaniorum]|uniref:Uncharacterized protein n=1 Tax=Azospirillum baldaniorum TaxID=1064539 RepID=A0A9P1K019_9PROT|nr:hypothetical protein Sp245p_25335 [Azospirillum baldaniorum]CCD03065.1 protein of unknown function [Azospirillum baldaniorum]